MLKLSQNGCILYKKNQYNCEYCKSFKRTKNNCNHVANRNIVVIFNNKENEQLKIGEWLKC